MRFDTFKSQLSLILLQLCVVLMLRSNTLVKALITPITKQKRSIFNLDSTEIRRQFSGLRRVARNTRMSHFSTIPSAEGSALNFDKNEIETIEIKNNEITDIIDDAVKDTGACTLVNNAEIVLSKVEEASLLSGRECSAVRLVCVSKTKPSENIQTLYDAGFRDFGENYFQELLLKAETLPQDIKWHFIGHLQSTKAMKLVKSVPNLSVVETVDSLKLAKKLDSACEAAKRAPLQIYIQVDTSGEDTKSGVTVDDVTALVVQIKDECPLLIVAGLMTIGAPDDFNCFDRLVAARVNVAAALGVPPSSLALSMGMSGDYEVAIQRGSTNVRVGSTIFGQRLYAKSNPLNV